ncbi:MAG TPA: NTP transferase domain-containing protein [Candidatus Tumulicola sp.]
MKAVVTAGGRVEGEYAREAGTAVKALAAVRGATMLDRILDALRGAGVTRLAVVGGAEVRAACGHRVELIVDEGASGSANVLRALDVWPDDDGEPLLYATSDLPYVTAAAVTDFVRRSPPSALCVALAEHAVFEHRFPAAPPFGITLARERVVNGGVFSIPPGSCARLGQIAGAFFESRKRPWRMATLVSPFALLRLAFGRLRITEVETLAGKIAGVPAVALRNCAPELGYDADTLLEYRYACRNA